METKTTIIKIKDLKQANKGRGGKKIQVDNKIIVEWLNKCYDWMLEEDENMFYKKWIIENCPFSFEVVSKRLQNKEEDIVSAINKLKTYQEQKLLYFLMLKAKNPVAGIFILANKFGYRRQDEKVEILENKDEKDKVIFRFDLSPDKILPNTEE
jgi:hypothetical protein